MNASPIGPAAFSNFFMGGVFRADNAGNFPYWIQSPEWLLVLLWLSLRRHTMDCHRSISALVTHLGQTDTDTVAVSLCTSSPESPRGFLIQSACVQPGSTCNVGFLRVRGISSTFSAKQINAERLFF